jgi:hypothetical protein
VSQSATNDVDRALASLGSTGIGYRKFRPQIEMSQSEVEWVDASPAKMNGSEAEFPLLAAVFPDARFERSEYQIAPPSSIPARYLEPVDAVAPEQTAVPRHDLPGTRATHRADAMPVLATETALTLTTPRRQTIRLSDMFKALRDGSPPAELTMSQLQDVFRRL